MTKVKRIISIALAITVLLIFIGCSSKNAVVGTWKGTVGGTMQFLSDGTFTSTGILGANGKYSFPDSSHIKFEYNGLLSIAGSQVLEYKIDNKTMTLTDTSGNITELTKD